MNKTLQYISSLFLTVLIVPSYTSANPTDKVAFQNQRRQMQSKAINSILEAHPEHLKNLPVSRKLFIELVMDYSQWRQSKPGSKVHWNKAFTRWQTERSPVTAEEEVEWTKAWLKKHSLSTESPNAKLLLQRIKTWLFCRKPNIEIG
jgi:hypothetical protein